MCSHLTGILLLWDSHQTTLEVQLKATLDCFISLLRVRGRSTGGGGRAGDNVFTGIYLFKGWSGGTPQDRRVPSDMTGYPLDMTGYPRQNPTGRAPSPVRTGVSPFPPLDRKIFSCPAGCTLHPTLPPWTGPRQYLTRQDKDRTSEYLGGGLCCLQLKLDTL